MHYRSSTIQWILPLAALMVGTPSLGRAASEQVIYAFSGNAAGDFANSPLVSIGSKFYGTTEGGGTHGYGTIFSVDATGSHVVLYKFKGGTDGWAPVGGLVEVGGILYGVTLFGGISGGQGNSFGTVFSITPQGAYKQIYAFKGSPTDGGGPLLGLVVLGNLLYGTTGGGGSLGGGTVFSITTQGSESLLYSFQNGSDGFYPSSIITDGVMLYGTTELGAGTDCNSNGCGAIFMMDPQGNETTLHTFGNGDEGGNPFDPLLKVGNQLYGGTYAGGSQNLGVVFKLSLTGVYKDLHDFMGTDGEHPESLIDVEGTLYGTADGGSNKDGTVFTMTKKGALTTIYNFQGGSDGANPGNLLAVSGTLYGTTRGDNLKCTKANPPDCGTVFSVTP